MAYHGPHGRQCRIMANGEFDVWQEPVNGFDISYNPDDERWYVSDRNTFGDLETRATFAGNRKGFHNARRFAVTHKPR